MRLAILLSYENEYKSSYNYKNKDCKIVNFQTIMLL